MYCPLIKDECRQHNCALWRPMESLCTFRKVGFLGDIYEALRGIENELEGIRIAIGGLK